MKQTRMKYVVTIPVVLLVVTIVTLALFVSIYPIKALWKPVFASPDTLACYPSNYTLLGIIQTATPRR